MGIFREVVRCAMAPSRHDAQLPTSAKFCENPRRGRILYLHSLRLSSSLLGQPLSEPREQIDVDHLSSWSRHRHVVQKVSFYLWNPTPSKMWKRDWWEKK